MAFKISIELSERDLRHFRRELGNARKAVRIADDEEILSAARDLVASFKASKLPDFVRERFGKLQKLLEMLADPDWRLADRERGPVLAALAYLCDPEDIIPDSIPGIGLLDDAVMIELVFQELRHEIEAYDDFVRFRASLKPGIRAAHGQATVIGPRLERRRAALVMRMRRRRVERTEQRTLALPGNGVRPAAARGSHDPGHQFLDLSRHALARLGDRDAHGVRKCGAVRATVTLDHHASETNHARAIVRTGVEPELQCVQHRCRADRAQLAQRTARELLAHHAADEPRKTFHRLEGHVAGESVCHDDVHVAGEDLVAFDEARVVDRRRGKSPVRLADFLRALDVLLADVEQADTRVLRGREGRWR